MKSVHPLHLGHSVPWTAGTRLVAGENGSALRCCYLWPESWCHSERSVHDWDWSQVKGCVPGNTRHRKSDQYAAKIRYSLLLAVCVLMGRKINFVITASLTYLGSISQRAFQTSGGRGERCIDIAGRRATRCALIRGWLCSDLFLWVFILLGRRSVLLLLPLARGARACCAGFQNLKAVAAVPADSYRHTIGLHCINCMTAARMRKAQQSEVVIA